MVGRGAIVEHPARGPLEGNFRQNNASPLLVTVRPPYNKLEGVLKRDTFLKHTSQGIQVQKIPPTLQKYSLTPFYMAESVNNTTHTCKSPCLLPENSSQLLPQRHLLETPPPF